MVSVILLCGGIEKKFWPISLTKPPFLLPIFSKTLLEYWLQLFTNYNINEIIVATNPIYEKRIREITEKYKQKGLLIKFFISEKVDVGSAGAAFLALEYVNDDDIVIIFANTFLKEFDPEILKVSKENIRIFCHYSKSPMDSEILVDIDNKCVKTSKNENGLFFAGILSGKKRLLHRYLARTPIDEKTDEYKIKDTLNLVIKENAHEIVEISDFIRINTPQKYFLLMKDYGLLFIEEFISNTSVIHGRIFGSVYIGENSVIGPDASIRGPVLIGDNVIIEDGVKIKPYSIILDRTRVECNAIIKESVLFENVVVGENAIIKNSIIDENSVIGSSAVVGGNPLLDEKKDYTLIGSNCKIGESSVVSMKSRIGPNSIVFPNSYLSREIPPNSLYLPDGRITTIT